MSITYLSTVNRYLGKHSVFTPQELDCCDSLEKEWLNNQPHYNLRQLLEIFPTAKNYVKKHLKEKIKEYKNDLQQTEQTRKTFNNEVLNRTKYENRWFYELVRDIIYVFPLKEGREKKIKQICFFLSSLRPTAKGLNARRFTEADIARAKEVPIESLHLGHLYKRGNIWTGLCPFHHEQHGSFVIYHKQNKWYCFGACAEGGDVINYIMKTNQCSFIEAVKFLINK